MIFSYQHLHNFTASILQAIGCLESDAKQSADVLLSADLRGIDSHGVARLIGYVRLYEKGRINPTPELKIAHETPSTGVLDGDKALGLVAGPAAMRLAIEKANKVGSGWIAVKNSNHYGIAGYHTMMALEHDCIGISMTNASPLVAPTYSKERLLGTNPISVAIPTGEEPAFVADMASTTAANGKLEILQRKGLEAPDGWIQDTDGKITNDPYGVQKGGALLPLGGAEMKTGSHKGFILGSIVDIFSAVLSGANYGPWVPPFVAFLDPDPNPVGQGIGHFFGAMRIDGFRPADEFKSHMDNWIRRFRSAKKVGEKSVVIPGDPEREMEAVRMKEGIPVLEPVVKDLKSLSEKYGVPI